MEIYSEKGELWLNTAEAFAIYGQCMYQPSPEKYREKMNRLCRDAANEVFVCSDRGEPVGMMVLGRRTGNEAEILGIAVKKDRQKNGIGRFMVDFAAERFLRLFAETDGEAVDFYEKMGFSILRNVEHFPDGDCIRYQCTLEQTARR